MDDALAQIVVMFREEFREHHQGLTRAVVEIAQTDSPQARAALFGQVYRAAHSVKGTAGTLGFADVEQLAHAVESALTPYRTGEQAPAEALLRLVLLGMDQAQQRLESSAEPAQPDPALTATTAELLRRAALAGGAAGAAPAPRSEPAEKQPRTAVVELPTASAAPQPTSGEAGRAAAAAAPAGEVVRVTTERLSALERHFDELRELRGSLEERGAVARRMYTQLQVTLSGGGTLDPQGLKGVRDQLQQLSRSLSADAAALSFRLSELDEDLRAIRMEPMRTLLSPLSRAVWEHASTVGKQVRLELDGVDVALDRRLLQELKDPFLHLVRNAVDHGIEPPEERAARGKPPEGVIRIDVEQRGATVHVTLADDGRGVDCEKVRRRAVKVGLISAERARALDEAQTHELLFSPGFSTAEVVSRTSGRGVGLDVVRENLARVGGKVRVESVLGAGARFRIELPLTLATAQALLFESCGQLLALPLASVVRARHLSRSEESAREARELEVDGELLQVREAAALLGGTPRRTVSAAVVVVRGSEQRVALRVDRVVGEREVVLRRLPPELLRGGLLTAAAPLGDGRLVFVLNARAVVDAPSATRQAPARTARPPRVVVADDSITTRSLHRQVLEAAGFEVTTAPDGEEAFRILRSQAADLLVSDINMPRLDGLSLARRVRADPQLAKLPIILISSHDTEEDYRRAAEAGASEYLPKSAYQRGELLRLARALVAGAAPGAESGGGDR